MEAAVELDDRKARVLRAVIQDFVKTAEPVGSKTLVERYALGVSPATVRNELAALEEQGYLSHPHTSAGRVPTDLGYRWYVDTLRNVSTVARAQQEAIERYFDGVADLEETLLRTSVLLASLTELAAVVVPPSLDRSRLRHVELVSLARRAAMIVLIVETGRVAKRVVELPAQTSTEQLDRLRKLVNAFLSGQRLDQAAVRLRVSAAKVEPDLRRRYDAVADAIGRMADDQGNQQVFIGGQAHIARLGVDPPGDAIDAMETVRAVFEALEQQVILLRLLQAAMGSGSVSVTIGSENVIESMRACSVVAAQYLAGDAIGNIGVLGPTRMDYLRAMVAVQAVAKHLGAVLEDVAH
jgi:heat-inducible transcriptional repressor